MHAHMHMNMVIKILKMRDEVGLAQWHLQVQQEKTSIGNPGDPDTIIMFVAFQKTVFTDGINESTALDQSMLKNLPCLNVAIVSLISYLFLFESLSVLKLQIIV